MRHPTRYPSPRKRRKRTRHAFRRLTLVMQDGVISLTQLKKALETASIAFVDFCAAVPEHSTPGEIG